MPLKCTLFITLLFISVLFTNCQVVKEYQKNYVNDYYIQPNALSDEKLESEGIQFREGAVGGDGGKTGGGCGCN